MKLLFACPTYGPTEPEADISRRIAIMHASRHGGVTWVGDASPNKMKFEVARMAVVKSALEHPDADGVFWCDSDVILPPEAISQIVSHGDPFVSGIYFQRAEPFWPLIAHQLPNDGSFQWVMKWPDNAYFPMDGCGFGCVYTSTKMLRDIGGDWFTYEKFSEDFDFCRKARRKGYTLMVDSSVLCGHLQEPKAVTLDTFRQHHADLKIMMKEGAA